MQDIESVVVQNYEKSMLYFEQKYPDVFNKLKALELLLSEGKYPQKYDLEFKDGYFDVIDLASGNFMYNTDSNNHAHKLVDEINFKKNTQLIETFHNINFDDESVKAVKKLTAFNYNSTMVPIINYYNKYIDKSMLMSRIYKFMFLGVGLGLHIENIVKKTNGDIFLVLEDDIELFRLSLFTCNYEEAFKNKKVFFGIAQNSEEFQGTFEGFYGSAFVRNQYLKFSLFSSREEVHIKKLQTAIVSRSENCYHHAGLLVKNLRVLEKISKDYKFLSLLKKDEKFFDEKPILVLGAGPSLGANKEWLRQHKNNFIIIAPFATLGVLYPLDIAPDIIVHIDEGDVFANREVKLYEGKKDFFKNTLFVFSVSVPQIFFDTFDKDVIYLLEESTKYKLNDNYITVASVGETVYAIALSLTHQDVYLLGLDMALADDGSSHSKAHPTKSKADISRIDKLDDSVSLRKTVLNVKGNFRDKVVTIPVLSMSIPLMNLQTKKYKSKDQHIYNLCDGAYFQDTIPLRLETIEFKNEGEKEHGAVQQGKYGITFVGYYKKSDSNDAYDIDVYIDGSRIETLKADKKLKKVEDIFDIDNNGFEFTLKDKYLQEPHLLEFKESKSGKLLMDGSVKTISMQDKKFNEFRFMDSVEQVDAEKIKDMYCPNSIGFMATKENMEDIKFINYIKELMIRFPDVEFKGFYFDDLYEKQTKTIFANSKVKFYIPKNIYKIAEEIEIYLCSNKIKMGIGRDVHFVLRRQSSKILSQSMNFQCINSPQLTIKEFEQILSVQMKKLLDNFETLGFMENEILEDKSYIKTFQNVIFKRFNLGECFLRDNDNVHEYFDFKIIEYALQSKDFKKFYFDTVLGQMKILQGD